MTGPRSLRWHGFTIAEVRPLKVPLWPAARDLAAAKIAADLGADCSIYRATRWRSRCAARHRFCRRAEARFPVPQHLQSARLLLDSRPRGGAARPPPGRAARQGPMPACSRTGLSRPLLRAGKATPIEIAAFPVERMPPRAVSGLVLQAWVTDAMIGERAQPLKLGGHRVYAAGLTPSPALLLRWPPATPASARLMSACRWPK